MRKIEFELTVIDGVRAFYVKVFSILVFTVGLLILSFYKPSTNTLAGDGYGVIRCIGFIVITATISILVLKKYILSGMVTITENGISGKHVELIQFSEIKGASFDKSDFENAEFYDYASTSSAACRIKLQNGKTVAFFKGRIESIHNTSVVDFTRALEAMMREKNFI